MNELWSRVYQQIASEWPQTIISAYRGDVCGETVTVYTNDGPRPNSSDTSNCQTPNEKGKYFHPIEMHGYVWGHGWDGHGMTAALMAVSCKQDSQAGPFPPHLFPSSYTIQEGPDGRTPKIKPTFWFWHNEVGHLNASSIFDGLRYTVGHGTASAGFEWTAAPPAPCCL